MIGENELAIGSRPVWGVTFRPTCLPIRRLAVPLNRISDRTRLRPFSYSLFYNEKNQNYFMVLMLTLMGTVVFSSCSSDDDDKPSAGSQSKSWFIEVSQEELDGAKADFTTCDPLSKRQEIVDELSRYDNNWITSPNLFKSDYMNDEGRVTIEGDLYDYFKNVHNMTYYGNGIVGYAWHIVDNRTIEKYYGISIMYGDSKNIARKLIHVGSWNYWGKIYMAIHKEDANPSIYTYVKVDNKLLISDGTIIHLYDDYAIYDRNSDKMIRFTPVDR